MANVYYNNSKVAGGANKYLDPRVSEMPTPSEDLEGEVVQYVGATSSYTNGLFYICKNSTWQPMTANIYVGTHNNFYRNLAAGINTPLNAGYFNAVGNSNGIAVQMILENNRMIHLTVNIYGVYAGNTKELIVGWQPTPLWHLDAALLQYIPRELNFFTYISRSVSWHTQMIIKPDGSVNVYGLENTGTGKTFSFTFNLVYDLYK